tara:strand:- start:79 stop:339 length:261 start_codon:yes stop_codon:yes gene_type:complete
MLQLVGKGSEVTQSRFIGFSGVVQCLEPRVQPYSVWWKGFLVMFCETRHQAQAEFNSWLGLDEAKRSYSRTKRNKEEQIFLPKSLG